MNPKVEIWKRKLLKEKLKQQAIMWDRLKRTEPHPSFYDFDLDAEIAKSLGEQMAREIDNDILKTLKGELVTRIAETAEEIERKKIKHILKIKNISPNDLD